MYKDPTFINSIHPPAWILRWRVDLLWQQKVRRVYEMLLTLSLIFSMSELAGEDLILHYWVIVMKMEMMLSRDDEGKKCSAERLL